MSVKKSVSLNNAGGGKRRRFDRCFTSIEVPMEPGKSLKEMDSEKLKTGIRKWAKAVVAFARQFSDRFGKRRG